MKLKRETSVLFEHVLTTLTCSRYRPEQTRQQRARITLTNLSFSAVPIESTLQNGGVPLSENGNCNPSNGNCNPSNGNCNPSNGNCLKSDNNHIYENRKKYTKLGRSLSLLVQKPRPSPRRTQSCKENEKKNDVSKLILESCTEDVKNRKRSRVLVDAAVQTRFSLNEEAIRDIGEMLKCAESDDSSDAYSEIEDAWSESEEENEEGEEAEEEREEFDSSERHQPDRQSGAAEHTTSTENGGEHKPDNCLYGGEHNGFCYTGPDPLFEHNSYTVNQDVCVEQDSNIHSVLPSLQSRRGAVHSAVNVTDPKDKFKIPFLSKRKTDRKWSRNELSSIVKEGKLDKPHPLDGLMMSHWSELMSEERAPPLNSVEYKHRDALWGLFRAEVVYLTHQLKIIRDVFQGTLKTAKDNGFLSDIDESTLFPNVNKLYKVSNSFSLDLYKMFTEGQACDESVISALQDFAQKFHQPYQRYCLNYTRAAKYLKSLEKERSDFRDYEKVCLEDKRCKKRQLSDLLICPMQHLMRYVILLQDIAKHVPEHGKSELKDTIEMIQESLRSLESKLGTLQNFQRLQELDTILIWPKIDSVDKSVVIPEELKGVLTDDHSTLCSDGRHVLYAGSLILLENPKSSEIYTFLFDDMLLLTRTNSSIRKSYLQRNAHKADLGPASPHISDAFDTSGGLYDPEQRYIVYKQPVSLDEIKVHDIASSPGGCKHCFSITTYNRLNYCTGLYTFNAGTRDNKDLWLGKLQRASEEFAVSHPPTPVTRARYDSTASTIHNGSDSVSLLSYRSSAGNVPAHNLPDKHKKNSLSFRSIAKHKVPKRCRSS